MRPQATSEDRERDGSDFFFCVFFVTWKFPASATSESSFSVKSFSFFFFCVICEACAAGSRSSSPSLSLKLLEHEALSS